MSHIIQFHLHENNDENNDKNNDENDNDNENDTDNENCFFLSELNKSIAIYIPFLSHKIPFTELFFLPVCIKEERAIMF